jgi:hypothetical protein
MRPDEQRRAFSMCGWPVKVTRAWGWVCCEPFGHDTEHAIRDADGTVTTSAAGYSTDPVELGG